MARKGCGFVKCGRSPAGEGPRHARSAACKRCRAYSSAPSTPRGTRSRSRSPSSRAPTPSSSSSSSRGRSRRRAWCFGGGPTVSTRSKYRDTRRNINPKALPIVLQPDHLPRKTRLVHVCHSPRRGCTDHRCHKEKGWCTIS